MNWRYNKEDTPRPSSLNHTEESQTARSFLSRMNPFNKKDDNKVRPFNPEDTTDGLTNEKKVQTPKKKKPDSKF